MKFYVLEPEVAGGLGDQTIMNQNLYPPVVHHLHYVFEGWLGDDILESFPCFLVTNRLKNEIVKNALSGVEFGDLEVTASKTFQDLNTLAVLPSFTWLKPGKEPECDFSLSIDHRLRISEKALSVLRGFAISHAAIALADH